MNLVKIFSTFRNGLKLLQSHKVPRRVKLGIVGLFILYLVFPIDIMPDFLPILGFADEVVLLYFMFNWLTNRYMSQKEQTAQIIDAEIVE